MSKVNLPKLPEGYRWLEKGEILTDGDIVVFHDDSFALLEDRYKNNKVLFDFWYARKLVWYARKSDEKPQDDPVNHPKHYTSHPSGVEAIQICEHMNFCLGNAMKYIWRASLKGSASEDLKKATWYINREISRLEKTEQK